MPKNIIVFADGTGQEGGRGRNTNVYDLFNIIEDRTERQVSYYDKGLGTGWRKVSGNICGAGISRNIKECYRFIFENYDAGDQIYLFGFSRGATTVRTLSAFIHRFGILPQSRPELIDRAYAIYQIRNKEKRRRKAREFVSNNHTMWCRVKFLGAWDTVAALGVPNKAVNWLLDQTPFRHSFHDLKLAPIVDYARHAIAIDDERKIFHPTLWDETDEDRSGVRNAIHFDVEDIPDVFSVAERLRFALESETAPLKSPELSQGGPEKPADPLSRYLVKKLLAENSGLLVFLRSFNPENDRVETEDRVRSMKARLTDFFNEVTRNRGESIYDALKELTRNDPAYNLRDDDKFAGIVLSRETQERVARKRHSKKLTLRGRQRLNRLLLEDGYQLNRMSFPRIKQVWFSGVHTDVGGGYSERGLSHVPLIWMLSEAMELGLLIYEKHRTEIRPDPSDVMHDSRKGWARWIYSQCSRSWDADKNRGNQPLVHESVLLRKGHEDLGYDPWILKMKHEVESWPKSLRSSVQFDDYFIWREAFWGWGCAFSVPWVSVQHLDYDEMTRTLIIHTNDERETIEVKGSLSIGIKELLREFDRRKAKALEDKQDREAFEKVGKDVSDMKEKFDELTEKVTELQETLDAKEAELERLRLEKRIPEN